MRESGSHAFWMHLIKKNMLEFARKVAKSLYARVCLKKKAISYCQYIFWKEKKSFLYFPREHENNFKWKKLPDEVQLLECVIKRNKNVQKGAAYQSEPQVYIPGR